MRFGGNNPSSKKNSAFLGAKFLMLSVRRILDAALQTFLSGD
jgi:hypothetical protein